VRERHAPGKPPDGESPAARTYSSTSGPRFDPSGCSVTPICVIANATASAASAFEAKACDGTVDAPNIAPHVSDPTLPSISSDCPVTSMNRDWKSFTARFV